MQGGVDSMCKEMEMIYNEGAMKGIEKGMEQGIAKGIVKGIRIKIVLPSLSVQKDMLK